MRARFYIFLWSSVIASGFFIFNNCSEVKFSDSPTFIAKQAHDLNESSNILIENGAEFTNQNVVQLKLNSPRAIEMKISNQADCSDGSWEPYNASKAWSLQQNNSNASVYATYKNLIGQVSKCVSDDITHDNVAPQLNYKNAAGHVTNEANLLVEFTATDSLSGIEAVSCQNPAGAPIPCTNNMNVTSTIEGQNQVSIRARDRAGNESGSIPYSWLFDKTPPTVKYNKRPASTTSSTSAEFEFIGEDALSGIQGYRCRLEGGQEQDCTSPKNETGLGAGPHKMFVIAIDKAGNRSTEVAANWVVDLSAPTLRFTETPNPNSNTQTGRFSFDGTDDGQPITQFECRVDGGSFAACNSPFNTPNLTQGQHSFEVRGKDPVGNMSAPIRYEWLIDLTNPTVVINQKPPQFTNLTHADFLWTATDTPSGVERVECRLDSGSFASCGLGGQNFPTVSEGAHKIDVRAVDRAGNQGSAMYQWTVDVTAPTITITSGPNRYVRSTSATFTFVGSDQNGIQGYRCRVDSGDFTGCTSPFVKDNLAPGGHVFFVQAIDKAGNPSASATWQWNIDLSAPIIRVISSPSIIKRGEPATISFEVTDLASGLNQVRCGLAGTLNTCSANAVVELGTNLSVGKYSFEIEATDRVGNTAREVVSFEVTNQVMICDPFSPGADSTCDGGMTGEIYYLDAAHQTTFKNLSNKNVNYFYDNGIRVDALLNLSQLFVSTRDFTGGFPTTTGQIVKDNNGNDLVEYFAFRLESVLKLDPTVDLPGYYQLATISDDGSVIATKNAGSTTYDKVLINNDGDHSTKMGCSTQAIYVDDTTRLPLLIKYYQGPRTEIAMTLIWRKVDAINSALDTSCGYASVTDYFGPMPYNNFTTAYRFGQLTINRGWKVIAPSNFLAPAR